jgi:hypothetical protein
MKSYGSHPSNKQVVIATDNSPSAEGLLAFFLSELEFVRLWDLKIL